MAPWVDPSSPPMVVGAEQTVTTGAFDPPADSVLVAVVAHNHYGTTTYNGSTWTISNNGTALTWELAVKRNNQDRGAAAAGAAIYVANLGAARTAMTVTASVVGTSGTADNPVLSLYVVRDADLADIIGAVSGGFSSSNTASLTTPGFAVEAADSLMIFGAVDYSASGPPTAPGMSIRNGTTASVISYLSGFEDGPTTAETSASATFNSASGSANWTWVGIEIRPGAATKQRGTITYVGAGAWATGTTSFTAAYPSGNAQGDCLLLTVHSRESATVLPNLSGWVKFGESAVGSGTVGSGTGPTRITYYARTVPAGGLSGSLSSGTLTGVTVCQAQITCYRVTGGNPAWSQLFATASVASGTTGRVATVPTGDNVFKSGDYAELCIGVPDDSIGDITVSSVSSTGATVGTPTQTAAVSKSSSANQISAKAYTAPVTAGPNTTTTTTVNYALTTSAETSGVSVVRLRALVDADAAVDTTKFFLSAA